MTIRQEIQAILDNILLPQGILSSHIRRVVATEIKGKDIQINQDEYVIYRIVSTTKRFFGDGKNFSYRTNFDINYYYKYDKNTSAIDEALKRMSLIEKAFDTSHNWNVVRSINDIYDIDNDYRGFNIEVSYIGVQNEN